MPFGSLTVESSELLDPDTPNYFAQAWRARDLLTQFVGHDVPRSAVGLAINTAHSRTQDQFHVHIECLRQDVAEIVAQAAHAVTEAWRIGQSADERGTGDGRAGAVLERRRHRHGRRFR